MSNKTFNKDMGVSGYTAEGQPWHLTVTVEVTQAQIYCGEHVDLAGKKAEEAGCKRPFLIFE